MKIGFTCSTFDLLHAGHVQMLRDAKSQCDYLIVGLQIDPSVDRKEKNAPFKQSLKGIRNSKVLSTLTRLYPMQPNKT